MPSAWIIVGLVIIVVAGGVAFFPNRSANKAISLPMQLDGQPRKIYQESDVNSPFDQHPVVHLLEAGYGTSLAAPGSFGISVWVPTTGPNEATTAEILTLGLPSGAKADVFGGVKAQVDGADFQCSLSTTNASAFCAWTDPQDAAMVGTRTTDLNAALAQVERIRSEIGA